MNQLFVQVNLTTPKSAFETLYLNLEPVRIGEAPSCPTCGKFIGPRSWLPPHRVKLDTWGKDFGDIVYGPGSDFLASGRFVSLWEDAGFVGLVGFDPVEIVKVVRHARLKDKPPKYFRVDVVRSRAAVDATASGFEGEKEVQICSDCRTWGIIDRVNGIRLEPSPVPAEDVFIARGLPGTILASNRFHDFCTSHSIRNANFVPASEYSFGR